MPHCDLYIIIDIEPQSRSLLTFQLFSFWQHNDQLKVRRTK